MGYVPYQLVSHISEPSVVWTPNQQLWNYLQGMKSTVAPKSTWLVMFFSPSRMYIYIYMPARNKTSVCGRKNHEGRQVGLQYKKDSTWSALEVPTFTVQNYLLVQVNLGEIFWAQIELLRINHRIIKVLLRLSQLFVFLKLSSFASQHVNSSQHGNACLCLGWRTGDGPLHWIESTPKNQHDDCWNIHRLRI